MPARSQARSNGTSFEEKCMDQTRKPESRNEKGSAIPRIDASALLGQSKEVILVHNEQEYRLRVTSNHKLILTK
jgi:hemin uptake protein HemP